jgi:hypothetical protein
MYRTLETKRIDLQQDVFTEALLFSETLKGITLIPKLSVLQYTKYVVEGRKDCVKFRTTIPALSTKVATPLLRIYDTEVTAVDESNAAQKMFPAVVTGTDTDRAFPLKRTEIFDENSGYKI